MDEAQIPKPVLLALYKYLDRYVVSTRGVFGYRHGFCCDLSFEVTLVLVRSPNPFGSFFGLARHIA
jgi:hypothetical protein